VLEMADEQESERGPLEICDISGDYDNRAVEIVEINNDGSIDDSDLLVVPNKVLKELRERAIDLRAAVEEYTGTIIAQRAEIAYEIERSLGRQYGDSRDGA
jgi:hypothetical protein